MTFVYRPYAKTKGRSVDLTPDSGTRQRGAAIFALAAAAATTVVLSAVFTFDALHFRLAPVIQPTLLPDGGFRSDWSEATLSAASQQSSAAAQWLQLLVVFGAIAVVAALVNGLIGLMAHTNERRYENALRAVAGASPKALMALHGRNALWNTMLGILAGAPAGWLIATRLRHNWHGGIATMRITPWLLLAIIACVAVSLLAALHAYKRTRATGWLGDALAPEARTTPGYGADDLRELLSTLQLSLAMAVLIVSGLVWSYSQARVSRHTVPQLQMQIAHVALGPATPLQRRAAIQRILQQAHATTISAESIASPGVLLGLGRIDKVISYCGKCARANTLAPLFGVETQQHVVGAHFFAVAGIPILLGREFDGTAKDVGSVVVNRSFAKQAFDDPDPVGKEISLKLFGARHKVIGVVADLPTVGLHALEADPGAITAHTPVPNAPAIYFSAFEQPPNNFDVVVRGTPPALAGVSFTPFASVFDNAIAEQNWFASVLFVLGLLMSAAALVGVAVTAMLAVKSRRLEFAIRRAVGARERDLWLLVFQASAKSAFKSLFFGTLLSLTFSRILVVFVPGLPVFELRVAAAAWVFFLFLVFATTMVSSLRNRVQI